MTYRLRSVMEGSQGRNLDTGTETDMMKECCLLTCSPQLAQPALLLVLLKLCVWIGRFCDS